MIQRIPLAGGALALLVLPNGALGQDFTVAPIDGGAAPPLPVVLDSNGTGLAVGAAGSPVAPLRYDGDGVTALPLLPGDSEGFAFAINAAGQITGRSTGVQQQGQQTLLFDRAVRWEPDGNVLDLEDAATAGAPLQLFRGADIDSSGRVVGFARDASIPAGRGFLWDNGTIVDLGNLPGTPPQRLSTAQALNDAGVVVGHADDSSGFQRAFRWESGAMVDLHAQAGVPGRTSDAHDISPSGLIAGSADFVADLIDLRTPALFHPDGTVESIATFGGGIGETLAVNASGDAVGFATYANGTQAAFLHRNGVRIDLNELIDPASGWTLTDGRTITDAGVITGNGRLAGDQLPYQLTPAPCPGSYLPFGPGCPGTGGFVPALAGFGCPTPGDSIRLDLQKGLGGAPGLILFGTGLTDLDLTPCSVLLDPLLPVFLPFQLDGAAPGEGSLTLTFDLAPGTPPGAVWIQALVIDAAGENFYASAPPLRIAIG